MHGNAVFDRMYGELGNDVMTGDDGPDYMLGDQGTIVPTGGNFPGGAPKATVDLIDANLGGTDTMDGGMADDHMYGGAAVRRVTSTTRTPAPSRRLTWHRTGSSGDASGCRSW